MKDVHNQFREMGGIPYSWEESLSPCYERSGPDADS